MYMKLGRKDILHITYESCSPKAELLPYWIMRIHGPGTLEHCSNNNLNYQGVCDNLPAKSTV